MYTAKNIIGRGYSVVYPAFEGNGYDTTNRFYEAFAMYAEEYFKSLINEDRRLVCRTIFDTEDDGETFTVSITLILRRCGRRCGERTITHRWRRWQGRDAVIDG